MKKTRKLLVAGICIVLATTLVSAALLQYFGKVETTITAKQSVLLNGQDWTNTIVNDLELTGGCCEQYAYTLENQGCVEALLDITTSINSYGKGSAGVYVTYYMSVEYDHSESIDIVDIYYLQVTVEDTGDGWLQWTFDFPTETWQGDGQLPLGLVIATDGVGGHPAFQIHNNDGTCAAYPWGTWLYSAWDDTAPGNWNGWMTGDDTTEYNTPVDDPSLDWVEASGAYYAQGTDGILQIRIKKAVLGDTFHWAAYPQTGGGWYSPYKDKQMPTPAGFTWGNSATVGTDNYHEAIILEEITGPFTLQPNEMIDFIIKYCLDIAIMPGSYTVTTKIVPVTEL
jgi:hypothetical protein